MTQALFEPPEDTTQSEDRTADDPSTSDAASNRTNATAGPMAVETDAGTASVSLPPTASAAEAAAVAAAISTHLEEADDDAEEPGIDRWKLSARLGRSELGRKRAQTPRGYGSGNEWKFATRTW